MDKNVASIWYIHVTMKNIYLIIISYQTNILIIYKKNNIMVNYFIGFNNYVLQR